MIKRHKRFNEALPYTYLITHKETGLMYHGVRFANVRLGIAPNNDTYRGSSSDEIIKRIYDKPDEFKFELRWTFDTVEDAIQYEADVNGKILLRNKNREMFANRNAWGNKVGAPSIEPQFGNKNGVGNKSRTGHTFSEETRLKLSIAGKNRKLTDEHKKRIGEGNSRRVWTEESRRRVSETLSGRTRPDISGERNGMFGKTHSEEARQKMSDARKGVPKPKTICEYCGIAYANHTLKRHQIKCKENN